MITKLSLGLALLLGSSAIWAADFHPLNVKPGQWESTMTVTTSGMPSIPPGTLEKLTPEQRARFEDKLRPTPKTTLSCVKKETLDKPFMFGHENKRCTHNIVTSTGSLQEIHVECSGEKAKSTGAVRIEAMDPEHVKGSVKMTTTMGERTMNIDSSFTAKWMGDTCEAAH